MKSYQFNYRVPTVLVVGLGPTTSHEYKFLQIAAENMWQAIEKIKKVYEDYEQLFDLSHITEMP